MSLTIREIEMLSKTIEQGLGLHRVHIKVYNNNPSTVKITDTATDNFFVVQYLGKFNVLVKPQNSMSLNILESFEDVILHLIDWQIRIA